MWQQAPCRAASLVLQGNQAEGSLEGLLEKFGPENIVTALRETATQMPCRRRAQPAEAFVWGLSLAAGDRVCPMHFIHF